MITENDICCSHYNRISTHLKAINDDDIATLLAEGEPVHSGTGGTSVKLEIDGVPVFVKLVPLNEIEGKLENRMSTKNLYNLPLYYQYGVGSAGFSVWREVSAHLMSTNWVLAGASRNFPLMYHWRIIEATQKKALLDEEKLKGDVAYWDGSSAVGERLRANYNARAHVALFIEHIPESLDSWLRKKLIEGGSAFDEAIEMVEKNLLETAAFINSKGMLHFDAHFQNILTDGKHLYFSDFGLTTSSQFALSKKEAQFFQDHQNYDRCYVAAVLVKWIERNVFGKDRLDVLQAYANGETPAILPATLTPLLSSIMKRYAPVAHKMHVFFDTLMEETKQAPYPASELERLWPEACFESADVK